MSLKYHILGMNHYGLNSYKLLKNKNYTTTISDIKKKSNIIKNIKIKNLISENFYFSGHPKHLIDKSKKIIYSPGIIKTSLQYKSYFKNKKNLSEFDLFYSLNKWKKSNILIITGSKGKTTLCKKIITELSKKSTFSKIYYMDRKKYTFSNLPKFKKDFFLVAEVDYQMLLLNKKMFAKYRIITSIDYKENKALKSNKLYLHAKSKILKGLKSSDYLISDNLTFKKIKKNNTKVGKNIIIMKNSRSISKKNKYFLETFLSLINNENKKN